MGMLRVCFHWFIGPNPPCHNKAWVLRPFCCTAPASLRLGSIQNFGCCQAMLSPWLPLYPRIPNKLGLVRSCSSTRCGSSRCLKIGYLMISGYPKIWILVRVSSQMVENLLKKPASAQSFSHQTRYLNLVVACSRNSHPTPWSQTGWRGIPLQTNQTSHG